MAPSSSNSSSSKVSSQTQQQQQQQQHPNSSPNWLGSAPSASAAPGAPTNPPSSAQAPPARASDNPTTAFDPAFGTGGYQYFPHLDSNQLLPGNPAGSGPGAPQPAGQDPLGSSLGPSSKLSGQKRARDAEEADDGDGDFGSDWIPGPSSHSSLSLLSPLLSPPLPSPGYPHPHSNSNCPTVHPLLTLSRSRFTRSRRRANRSQRPTSQRPSSTEPSTECSRRSRCSRWRYETHQDPHRSAYLPSP
jgi:hypothetical protein